MEGSQQFLLGTPVVYNYHGEFKLAAFDTAIIHSTINTITIISKNCNTMVQVDNLYYDNFKSS